MRVRSATRIPTLPDPAPFVGASRARNATARNSRPSGVPAMPAPSIAARSLATSPSPRPSFPDPAEPAVTHTLHQAGDRLVHETDASGRVFKAVVDYAFGFGDRGKTLVGRQASGPVL